MVFYCETVFNGDLFRFGIGGQPWAALSGRKRTGFSVRDWRHFFIGNDAPVFSLNLDEARAVESEAVRSNRLFSFSMGARDGECLAAFVFGAVFAESYPGGPFPTLGHRRNEPLDRVLFRAWLGIRRIDEIER